MKLKVLLIFLALMVAGCNAIDTKVRSQAHNANATSSPQVNDGIKRITPDELAKLMEEGKVVVLDVRNQQMYDAGHIRGARLIPFNEVDKHLDELPKDKQIVTYCS